MESYNNGFRMIMVRVLMVLVTVIIIIIDQRDLTVSRVP